MATIFSDQFSAYTIGQNPFDGFTDRGFFGGTIVSLAPFPGAPNAKGYHIGDGPIQYGGVGTTAMISGCSAYFTTLGDASSGGGNGYGATFQIGLSTDTSLGQIAYFQIELDNTVSFYVANQPFLNVPLNIANSPTPIYHANTWQSWQCDFSLSSFPVITGTGTSTVVTDFIAVTASLWLEGDMIFNNAFGVSGFNLTASGFGPLMNVYYFGHPQGVGGGGAYLADIWNWDSVIGTATFPFGSTGGTARWTQGVVEMMRHLPQNEARVTQGVVELVELPPTRHARITQGVVEIIKRNAPNVGGWQVYEV